jgi:integrase
MTVAESKAADILEHARVRGTDLIEEQEAAAFAKRRRAETSVAAIVTAYLAEPEVRRRKSFSEIKRYLEIVWRDLHELDAELISRHDLIQPLRRIAAERGATTANRARASLSACMTWAIQHGKLQRDNLPTTFLPSWDEHPRERALSLEELGQVWQAAPKVNPQFGRMIKLLILSGARRSEISDLTWDEVDLDRALISLPGSRTKNSKPLLIPLAPAAIDVLSSTPRLSDHKVFIGFSAWSWGKSRLDALVQIPSWRIHDLRRSAATGWREHLGADSHVCELALNHASGSRAGVAGVYDRSERLGERRQLLERWSLLVQAAAGEPAPTTAANIITLRGPGR